MKTAVVTGASGFLGSHLACVLHTKGYKVVGLTLHHDLALFHRVSAHYGLDASFIHWVNSDILDTDDLESAFQGADVVFHCAAMVAFYDKYKAAMYETNVNGTANVVNTCIKLGIKDLVYASSVAAIGRVKQSDVVNENTEWTDSKYNSHYAKSKYFAELEVWRGQEEGLNVYIVNPGVILGIGDGKKGSNQIFSITQTGNKVYPIGTTSFVGVYDVCMAMLGMYENNLNGKRILLVAENLSYKNLLSMVAVSMHKKPPYIALGGGVLWFLKVFAGAMEWLHIPFPYPKQGLKSTSSVSLYESLNSHLLPGFKYTPIQEVINETSAALYP